MDNFNCKTFSETDIKTAKVGLALVDFDGTIVKTDATRELIIELKKSQAPTASSSRYVNLTELAYNLLCKLISSNILFKFLSRRYLSNRNFDELEIIASVVLTTLEDKINKTVFDRIIGHKKKGHLVVVVSGSPEFLLRPFCNKWELKLIGTELEVVDGLLTGRIENGICLGKNKVFRLEQKLGKLSKFPNIYAYGDGKGDTAMLQLPTKDKRFYKEQLNFLKEL